MNTNLLRKTRWHFATLLASLVLLAGGPAMGNSVPQTNPADDPAPVWLAVAASGPVEASIAPGDEALWRDVSRGDELGSETHVKTGRKGRATLTRSSSVLMVAPHSEVELPGVGQGEMETSVIQTSGSVLYKVDGRANPHFEVVTPYLVAGVKGTTFLVTVNERYTSIVVEHGLVEVSDPQSGEIFHVGAGESAVHRGERGEMELVYDVRRSPETRNESRKLHRMRDFATDPEHKSLDLEPFDSAQNPVDLDKVGKELLEEMIEEGIQDGKLTPPEHDVVPVPVPIDPGEPKIYEKDPVDLLPND